MGFILNGHNHKITPHTASSQRSVEREQQLDFELHSSTTPVQNRFQGRPFLINALFSFKNFIFLFVVCSVVVFCLAYWLTTRLLSTHVADELTRVILSTILQKLQNLLNDRLTLVKALTVSLYRDWKTGHIKFVNGLDVTQWSDKEILSNKLYMQTRIVDYNFTGLQFVFGENSSFPLFKHGVITSYYPNWEIDKFNFFHQLNSTSFTVQPCQLKSGIIDGSIGNQRNSVPNKANTLDMCNYLSSPEALSNSSQFLQSQFELLTANISYAVIKNDLMKKKPPNSVANGVWYQPYTTSIYNTGLFYAMPLYDMNGNYQGYVSSIFNLFKLAGCFKRFRCKTKGFVVLSEFTHNTVLASTAGGKTADGLGRLNMFEMTTSNSGKVLKAAFDAGMDFYPAEYSDFQIEVDGVFYFLAHQRYKLDSIEWRMTIVVNDDNLQTIHYQQLYVSVAVTIAFFVVGLSFSFMITWMVIKPLLLLQNDFKNIAVMNLEKVQKHESWFAEYHSIYGHQHVMVNWLKDIRSFLPQNVLLQLEQSQSQAETTDTSSRDAYKVDSSIVIVKQNDGMEIQVSRQNLKMSSDSLNLGRSHEHVSSSNLTQTSQQNLHHYQHQIFGTGLQYYKTSIVISIHFANLNDMHPQDIANGFEKLIETLSQICSSARANLQLVDPSKFRIIVEHRAREEAFKKKALSIALKVDATIRQVNSLLEKEKRIGLEFYISVSSGSSFSGNLGSRFQKIYACINPSIERSDEMLLLAKEFGMNVVCDEETIFDMVTEYVCRPFEKLKFATTNAALNQENFPQLIYQVIGESHVKQDEWMYELQEKEKAKLFDQFNEGVRVLFSQDHQVDSVALSHSAAILEKFSNDYYSKTKKRDVVCDKLGSVMREMAIKEQQFVYCTQLRHHVEQIM
ncbi:hypothetical protein C9374_012131 [Naegleria lovaniensis]|uniref:Guanylate cyclase domain-containing protein n=1 Tax=Naegleria lovaniensis TaxID=51637 RepID=A0AA88GD49_NAELO|nr:uncharacterized protein C9374_012131 [Naegleria lovaniensis]KAG2373392.1 hypothetical protein C9374_012131 [Naegleria lovaniensis]